MKIIEMSYTIHAPKDVVWKALTNKEDVEKWSGADSVMDNKEGTEFKLWNGDIHGKNISVIECDELVQEWFGGNWDKPSKVTLTLTEKDDSTALHLLHEDVPEEEAENIADGWKEYYLEPLKDYVENELA